MAQPGKLRFSEGKTGPGSALALKDTCLHLGKTNWRVGRGNGGQVNGSSTHSSYF